MTDFANRLLALAAAAAMFASPLHAKDNEMHHAAGEFEVKLVPVSEASDALMRMSIDKQFHGDLEATSEGQMMAGGNEANGARVYVALETITGTLNGHKGSFILAHRGTMTSSDQALSIIIVPDSGTEDLRGIKGTFGIEITGGKHLYKMDYMLPET
jgi:Protein of unknown function (DUF3224)